METNASDYALAAILSIMTKDNKIHPVAFHSQTFSALELNYDIQDSNVPTSKIVRVPLSIQPHNSLPSWMSWYQTRHTH